MKILVCVKQVPDSAETVSIVDDPPRITYDQACVFRMNRYDEFALEEAVRIRQRFPGSTVHAVSIGPDRVRKTVIKALEMGADHGIHIREDSPGYLDPAARASLLARYVRTTAYDVILTGVMAEDDMECQVGQILAHVLGWPSATSVMHQEIDHGGTAADVEREIEGGRRECLTIALPAVFTVQSGINTPRYPSLSNVLRARSQQLQTFDARQTMNTTAITAFRLSGAGTAGEFLEGTPRDKARTLIRILHEQSVL